MITKLNKGENKMKDKRKMNLQRERIKELKLQEMRDERYRKRVANFLMSVEEAKDLKEAISNAEKVWNDNQLWRKGNELIVTQNISERGFNEK